MLLVVYQPRRRSSKLRFRRGGGWSEGDDGGGNGSARGIGRGRGGGKGDRERSESRRLVGLCRRDHGGGAGWGDAARLVAFASFDLFPISPAPTPRSRTPRASPSLSLSLSARPIRFSTSPPQFTRQTIFIPPGDIFARHLNGHEKN